LLCGGKADDCWFLCERKKESKEEMFGINFNYEEAK
jgi:hypothetical protein